ncbi:hypothetical protein P7C73_g6339, partial [Tremellales sp. Uapishka_1]
MPRNSHPNSSQSDIDLRGTRESRRIEDFITFISTSGSPFEPVMTWRGSKPWEVCMVCSSDIPPGIDLQQWHSIPNRPPQFAHAAHPACLQAATEIKTFWPRGRSAHRAKQDLYREITLVGFGTPDARPFPVATSSGSLKPRSEFSQRLDWVTGGLDLETASNIKKTSYKALKQQCTSAGNWTPSGANTRLSHTSEFDEPATESGKNKENVDDGRLTNEGTAEGSSYDYSQLEDSVRNSILGVLDED